MGRIILIIILLICASVAAEVKYIEVMDFSGGQVNSVINAKMQDNMGLIVKNFDIDELGHLHRRQGMATIFADAQSGNPITDIYAYQAPGSEKKIYLSRIVDNYFTDDTVINNVMLLTECDLSLNACTTYVYDPLYYPYRNSDIPFNSNYTTMNDKLIIASSYNNTILSNGSMLWPQQPLAAGELQVTPLNGGGNLSGIVRYKYCYLDKDVPDTSNLSVASKPTKIIDGKAVLTNFLTPWDTGIDSLLIYREVNYSQNWIYIGKIVDPSGVAVEFIDTLDESVSGDTATYVWGDNPAPGTGDSLTMFPNGDGIFSPAPPGGMNFTITNVSDANGILRGIEPYYIDTCGTIGYAIIFIDSFGTRSRISPLSYRPVDLWQGSGGFDSTFSVSIHDIPISNKPEIKEKILLRWVWAYAVEADSLQRRLYIRDTLDPLDSVYTDNGSSATYHTEARRYCDLYPLDTIPQIPESTCYIYDSTLWFQPTDIVTMGSRLFAIGDPEHQNRLYFSDFYQPQKWPYDKYMEIPSIYGDWFVRLAVIGQSLILFRQNSIVSFTGLSFYQYDVQTISNDIGITAYRSLIYGNQGIYFLHNTGFYRMNSDGGVQYPALSLAIQNSLDSITNYNLVWADMIGDEIWLSVPIDTNFNNRTYVYSLTNQNWKCYDFGIKDGIMIDYDTTQYIYPTSKWIFVMENDSLFRWNYSEFDSLDGAELINAEYQSKYFLDDPSREKILYIDIIGSGICDSLRFTFYDNYGDSIGTKLLEPDFTTKQRQRVKVDHIVENFSFKFIDYGTGDYKILGYKIAYIPWGERKER